MKKWVGNWIVATAILHTLFAFIVFKDTWKIIISNGIFNTAGDDAKIAGVVFFFLWGILFFAFGFTIKYLEKNNIPLPKVIGFTLLINAIIALIFVPESGFWLLLPPSIFILYGRNTR